MYYQMFKKVNVGVLYKLSNNLVDSQGYIDFEILKIVEISRIISKIEDYKFFGSELLYGQFFDIC